MSRELRSRLPRLDPTPREVFFNRRAFMATAGLGVAGLAIAGRARAALGEADILKPPLSRPDVFPAKPNDKYPLPKGILQDLTPRKIAATHNNYYEFLPGRGGPAWKFTEKFEVDPWKIEVGACATSRRRWISTICSPSPTRSASTTSAAWSAGR